MPIFVAKVENRTTLKISRKLIFRLLCCCLAIRCRYEGPWSISGGSIWSLTSPRVRRVSGSKKFRSPARKETFATLSARTGHSLPAFLRNARHTERSDGRCSASCYWPGPRSAAFRRHDASAQLGVAGGVSVDCAFRTHAHVLAWSYWPSVRYCGMNCPTDRRVPSIKRERCLKTGGSTMKALLSIPIAAALTCATLTAGGAEPLKQQLVGTWSVVSFVNENEKTGKNESIWFRSERIFYVRCSKSLLNQSTASGTTKIWPPRLSATRGKQSRPGGDDRDVWRLQRK